MKQVNVKLIIFLICGLFVYQHRVDAFLGMVLSLAQFAWSAFEMFNTAHDAYSKFTTPSTQDLLDKSEEIAASVDKWGTKLEAQIQDSMNTILTRLPLMSEMTDDIRILNRNTGRIDAFFEEMHYYRENPDHYSNKTLRKLIKSFTSFDADDVQGLMIDLQTLVIPSKFGDLKKSLFLLLATETQEHGLEICGTGNSPQQRLLQLFNIILETEMRALTLLSFGLLMEDFLDGTNSTGDMKRAEVKLVIRSKQYLLILKNTLVGSSTQFRACDPADGHERGVTFLEFEGFLQRFIASEALVSSSHECGKGCNSHEWPADVNFGCKGPGCKVTDTACIGFLRNCYSLEKYVEVCEPPIGSSTRRYEWYRDGANVLFGDDSKGCSGSLWSAGKGKFNGENCDICKCTCAQESVRSSSNHFISLRPHITDIENNQVVVGVRLVMIDRVLHIQVMQGEVEGEGGIREDSNVWVELDNLQYNREESIQQFNFQFDKISKNGTRERMKRHKDVAILSYAASVMGLDRMTVPSGYVMTGVKFSQNLPNTRLIYLEIHATALDPVTAKLDPKSSMWLTPEHMSYAEGTRENYRHTSWDNPLKAKNTAINTKPYMRIEVDSSGNADAGQTTIPLLDAIPVIAEPLMPFAGVGLYHKSQEPCAGFLTLVGETINLADFIPDDG